ncbi:MAG TPA: hypothetical protein PK625_01700, partial [Spirochaetales bacterium]|nr:hypothetical protein [Spirochaetales bacterium]
MDDDDKAARGQPALATAAASWVSNKAAERTGRLSWPLAAAFFLASAAAAALPFAAGRWRESAFLADIQNYDGLGAAFMAMAKSGDSWSVAGGALSTKGSGPAVFEAGAWATVVGQAGSPAPDSGKVLWFGSDRLVISKPESDEDALAMRSRLTDSIETALRFGEGYVTIQNLSAEPPEDTQFSENLACPEHGSILIEIEPRTFSFNTPHGACPTCQGLGTREEIDP